MQYRLRTLLIVLAIGPPVLVWMCLCAGPFSPESTVEFSVPFTVQMYVEVAGPILNASLIAATAALAMIAWWLYWFRIDRISSRAN
jgi:hypothetical protein